MTHAHVWCAALLGCAFLLTPGVAAQEETPVQSAVKALEAKLAEIEAYLNVLEAEPGAQQPEGPAPPEDAAALRTALENERQQRNALEQGLAGLRGEHEQLRAQHDQVSRGAERTVIELQKSLAQLEQMAVLRTDYEALLARLDQEQETATSAAAAREQAESRIATLEAARAEAVEQADARAQQVRSLREALAAGGHNSTAAEARLRDAQATIQQLQRELAQMQSLQQRAHALAQEHATLQQQRATAMAQTAALETELAQERERRQAEQQNADKQLGTAQAALEDQLAAARAGADELRQQTTEQLREIELFRRKAEEARALSRRHEELQRELDAVRRAGTEARQQNEAAEVRARDLATRVQQMTEQQERLHATTRGAAAARGEALEEARAARAEVGDLRALLAQAAESIASPPLATPRTPAAPPARLPPRAAPASVSGADVEGGIQISGNAGPVILHLGSGSIQLLPGGDPQATPTPPAPSPGIANPERANGAPRLVLPSVLRLTPTTAPAESRRKGKIH